MVSRMQAFAYSLNTDTIRNRRPWWPASVTRRGQPWAFFIGANIVDRVVIQAELFSEDSKHHSKYAVSRRQKKAARAVKTSHKKGAQANDLTGQRFGDLVVIEMTDERHHASVVFICRCDCGHEIEVTARHLKRKDSPVTHCGCKGIGRNSRLSPGANGIKRQNRINNPTVAFNALYAQYRHMATARGIQWDLTREQFLKLVSDNCYYCGVEPHQVFIRKPHKFVYNGVDRIDSGGRYTAANCVSCCGDCNVAKKERNVDDFLAWVERVHEYQQAHN